jgi:hypothetical protein
LPLFTNCNILGMKRAIVISRAIYCCVALYS